MASVLTRILEPRPAVKVVQAKLFTKGIKAQDRVRAKKPLPCVVQILQERPGA
jgi:hypothetical protein